MSSDASRFRGQSIIEMVSAVIVVTIVFLFLIDMGSLLLLTSKLDSVAKSAARAAAKEKDVDSAKQAAAQIIVNSLQDSRAMIDNVSVPTVDYEAASKKVTVGFNVQARITVPVPGIAEHFNLSARAVEPLVAAAE